MKKEYKTPVSEKIEFDYSNTVVASYTGEKGDKCKAVINNECGFGITNSAKKCFPK